MKTVNKERKVQLDRAIAYFLGWRIDNSFPDKGKVWRNGNSVELETTFKFSTDWNALMEIYVAINNLDEYFCRFSSGYLSNGNCWIYERGAKQELVWEAPHKEPSISLKEAVYRCLGEFIEAYNAKQLNVAL